MLSELLDEFENRLRQIIREEVRIALLEANNPSFKIESIAKNNTEKSLNTKDFPQLLTAPQVAELLGVKTARVYDLTRERKRFNFPVIIIGERSYRYSKEDIIDWMKHNN